MLSTELSILFPAFLAGLLVLATHVPLASHRLKWETAGTAFNQ